MSDADFYKTVRHGMDVLRLGSPEFGEWVLSQPEHTRRKLLIEAFEVCWDQVYSVSVWGGHSSFHMASLEAAIEALKRLDDGAACDWPLICKAPDAPPKAVAPRMPDVVAAPPPEAVAKRPPTPPPPPPRRAPTPPEVVAKEADFLPGEADFPDAVRRGMDFLRDVDRGRIARIGRQPRSKWREQLAAAFRENLEGAQFASAWVCTQGYVDGFEAAIEALKGLGDGREQTDGAGSGPGSSAVR
jgi:hypothetical protein